MSMTIGRCGYDFTFRNPSGYQISGNDYQFSGWIDAGSETLAKIARDQLSGLLDPGERDIPIAATFDPTLDGWYRINSVTVTPRPGFFDNGVFEWNMQATRVGTAGTHRAESIVAGTARATAFTVTNTDWHAIPSVATGYPARYAAYTTRVGPGGTAHLFRSLLYAATAAFDYRLDPDDWYTMAASVKVDGYLVQGSTHQNVVDDWEVSNGLLKVEPGTGGLLKVTVPGSTPSAWSSVPTHWKVGYWDGSAFQSVTTVDSVQVLRNDPVSVSLRLVCSFTSASLRPRNVTVDISVRRGDRLASVSVRGAFETKWGMETVASTAGTNVVDIAGSPATIGVRQTSNDAEGNRWVVMSASPITTSTGGPSRIYLTSDGAGLSLGVGAEYAGSGAAAGEASTDLRDQYFAVMSDALTVRKA